MQPSSPRPNWTTAPMGKFEWLDIADPTQADVELLGQKYPFHPLNLQDCLSKRQLPKVEDHDSYLFILLHFPDLGSDGRVFRVQLSIFVGDGYVVTLHPTSLAALKETAASAGGEDVRKSSKSPAHLVYSLIDRLVNGMFPQLDGLRDDLDGVEDDVFYGKSSAATKINVLRREIADIRRTVAPLRRTVSEASTLLQRYGTKDLAAYFRDVLDHIDKVTETLEQSTETVEIYKDTNFIMSSDRTNKVLTVLTILFTLTLPAAIVAAIYGMNVALPLGNGQNPPEYLGPFTSFIFLLAVMAIPTLLMIAYFRRRGWF